MLVTSTQVIGDIMESAQKARCIRDDKIQIVLGFCKGSAFLLQRWPDRSPIVNFVGSRFQGFISSKTRVTIVKRERGSENFAILLSSGKRNALDEKQLVFAIEQPEGESGGCIALYGAPDSQKLHVRYVSKRSSFEFPASFKVEELSYLWVVKCICEPLCVSYRFRINWLRLTEEIFVVRYRRIAEIGG